MRDPGPPRRLSRRRFLCAASLTAGALAAAPLRSACGAAERLGWSTPALHAALLPRSSLQPAMGPALLAGMQTALAAAGGFFGGRAAQILPYDAGANEHQTGVALGRLIAAGEVDLISGFISPAAASPYGAALREAGLVVLGSELGANVPRHGDESPHVFQHSSGYWQAALALDDRAARTLGRRAVLASSFYESGFDFPYNNMQPYLTFYFCIALQGVYPPRP